MTLMRFANLDDVPLDLDAAHLHALVHLAELPSTMDHAHLLAAQGAASGTVVVADVQSAGRGRAGKSWVSEAGAGLWFTLIERAVAAESLAVLSLRAGLAIAEVSAPWCDGDVLLKWPNDVLVREGRASASESGSSSSSTPSTASALMLAKLAGVLVEARWRDAAVDWVAIGVGLNLRAPSSSTAGTRAVGLSLPVSRAEVLRLLVPRLRAAAHGSGTLSDAELAAWSARDAMIGCHAIEPAAGVLDGVGRDGSLRVIVADGSVRACRTGSLVLAP